MIFTVIFFLKWILSCIGLGAVLYGINFALTYYDNVDKKKEFRDSLKEAGASGNTYNIKIP